MCYTPPISWEIETTATYNKWFARLAAKEQNRVVAVVETLQDHGPSLGRPHVDTVKGSRHPNMKEIRRGTIRILFAFDPKRTAVLLVGGDKRGQWKAWYRKSIKVADRRYDEHLRQIRRE